MPPINWQALRVSSNTRWAIYEETFPAKLNAALTEFPEALEAFDQVAAVDVLLAIAGALSGTQCLVQLACPPFVGPGV